MRTKCIFSDFWESTGASFKNGIYVKGEESIKKSIFTDFKSIYHIRAQCDEERLNDDQSEQEVELSNTRTASVIDIPNTLSLTRNDRKQKFQ